MLFKLVVNFFVSQNIENTMPITKSSNNTEHVFHVGHCTCRKQPTNLSPINSMGCFYSCPTKTECRWLR